MYSTLPHERTVYEKSRVTWFVEHIYMLFDAVSFHGMEQKKEVKLQANDNKTVVSIPIDVAKLSITLKDMLEDLPTAGLRQSQCLI